MRLSLVQHLERIGLKPYLSDIPTLKLQIGGLTALDADLLQRVQGYVATHREEIVRILKPYHTGTGPRGDGGPLWRPR